MAGDEEYKANVMTLDELAKYRKEMADELHELEWAQQVWPTEYKFSRITRLRERLALPIRAWEDYLAQS